MVISLNLNNKSNDEFDEFRTSCSNLFLRRYINNYINKNTNKNFNKNLILYSEENKLQV